MNMRKKIIISLLTVMALGFTACQKQNVPECKYHSQTLDLTVKQPDWQWDSGSLQYYFHFDVPEITSYVYNYGNWSICREFNAGTGDAYQVALPMSTYMVYAINDSTDGYYTQHIDYRLGIGYVEVQLTNSDYFYEEEKPENMLFRLQLIY